MEVTDYSSVSGTIERVILSRVYKNHIPDIPAEDLAQEIRMKCFLAIDKFDETKIGPNPFSYFAAVADNHLYNLKRGTWVPNNPPCLRCPCWDKKKKTCIINEEGCEKIAKYRENMRIRALLRAPAVQPDSEDCNPEYFGGNRSVEGDIDAFILDEHIRLRLPDELVRSYQLLITGQEIPYQTRRRVRRCVREILQEDE